MISIMRKHWIKIGIYFGSIFCFIFVFQLISFGINNPIILPSIWNVFGLFFSLFSKSKTYLCIANTLKHLIISLGISFIIGMILGIFGGLNKYIRLFLKPWMTIFRSLPIACGIVIIMILVGLSKTPYYVTCITLVPIFYEGFQQGIQQLDGEWMDVWKLQSKLNLKVIFRIYIPMILSHIKTSFIHAVGMGIKVIIMAEYLAGVKNTLGSAILPASNLLEYGYVYAYSIIIILLVLVVEALPKICFKCYEYFKFSKHQSLK